MPHVQERALAVLGLGPDASGECIKQAFRDLAQVWHPDRFTHDERLRAKAEEQFKEINGAYQDLCRLHASSREADSPSAHSRHAQTGPLARPARPAHTKPASPRSAHSSRNVRMQLPAVAVTFAGRRARLMNISITGGQLILDVMPEVESVGTLILEARGDVLRLDARVVRSGAHGALRREGGMLVCAVSVKFDNIATKDQRAIPRFCNMLLAETSASPR